MYSKSLSAQYANFVKITAFTTVLKHKLKKSSAGKEANT